MLLVEKHQPWEGSRLGQAGEGSGSEAPCTMLVATAAAQQALQRPGERSRPAVWVALDLPPVEDGSQEAPGAAQAFRDIQVDIGRDKGSLLLAGGAHPVKGAANAQQLTAMCVHLQT